VVVVVLAICIRRRRRLVKTRKFKLFLSYNQGDHSLENLENSGNSKVVREKSGKMEKVRKKSGEVKSRVFFQALNTPKFVFWPGLRPGPRWGSLRRSPRPLSRLGRGTPHFLPQLLQPQLASPRFSLIMKQRLLTISVNTRYRVIFACLY